MRTHLMRTALIGFSGCFILSGCGMMEKVKSLPLINRLHGRGAGCECAAPISGVPISSAPIGTSFSPVEGEMVGAPYDSGTPLAEGYSSQGSTPSYSDRPIPGIPIVDSNKISHGAPIGSLNLPTPAPISSSPAPLGMSPPVLNPQAQGSMSSSPFGGNPTTMPGQLQSPQNSTAPRSAPQQASPGAPNQQNKSTSPQALPTPVPPPRQGLSASKDASPSTPKSNDVLGTDATKKLSLPGVDKGQERVDVSKPATPNKSSEDNSARLKLSKESNESPRSLAPMVSTSITPSMTEVAVDKEVEFTIRIENTSTKDLNNVDIQLVTSPNLTIRDVAPSGADLLRTPIKLPSITLLRANGTRSFVVKAFVKEKGMGNASLSIDVTSPDLGKPAQDKAIIPIR